MSLIRYAGTCDFCGKHTLSGKGDFQSIGSLSKKTKQLYTGAGYKGKWLIRCFKCKGTGNVPLRAKNLYHTNK
jgi:hypothetical protein